jgi:hypothetical protein
MPAFSFEKGPCAANMDDFRSKTASARRAWTIFVRKRGLRGEHGRFSSENAACSTNTTGGRF